MRSIRGNSTTACCSPAWCHCTCWSGRSTRTSRKPAADRMQALKWHPAMRKGGHWPPFPFLRLARGSPDPHAVLRRDPQRIGFGHAERLVPGVDVARRREGAEVARRMGAVDRLLAQRIVTPQDPPHLGPAHEEALFPGEAVDHRRLLPVERAAVSLQRNR